MINKKSFGMEKRSDHVWVRWFYISNWSGLKAMNKLTLSAEIQNLWGFYGSEFWEKAVFEIIDGNICKTIPAIEFKK